MGKVARRFAAGLVSVAAAAACTSAGMTHTGTRPVAPSRAPTAEADDTSPVVTVYGRSVLGRPLRAWRRGDPAAPRRVLVVGVIHGDERAGEAVTSTLLDVDVPRLSELVVIPDANPDGAAAGTRQNAHGVDLNRNFPHDWLPLGRIGDQQYSGTGPLSEPESRALADLVRALQPTVTVWFHQPEGVVDESGGSVYVERRFAAAIGLPLRRLPRYPGSAVGWENHVLPGSTAFVVELPRHPSQELLLRAVDAVRAQLGP